MILDDFLVPTKIGLFCAYGNFYLDPKEAVKEAVISHAHGDHAVSGNLNVYCTEATSLFMVQRYKKFAAADFHIKPYHTVFELNGVRISFIPAGHILGSALVMMEYKGIKYLYTGDYKLQPDITCEPVEFVTADVLITETTFANPDTAHPDPEGEIKKLNTTRSNVMLGAYALGKSQRLIRMINDHCPEKRILVHHNIVPFVKIYEKMGINMGKYEVYDRKVMKSNPEHMIYIVPPMVYRSYIRAINVIRVFVTGWKHLQNNNELQIYISDHVDWKEILLTIEKVNPRQVWTTHGSGHQLKTFYENILEVKLLS